MERTLPSTKKTQSTLKQNPPLIQSALNDFNKTNPLEKGQSLQMTLDPFVMPKPKQPFAPIDVVRASAAKLEKRRGLLKNPL